MATDEDTLSSHGSSSFFSEFYPGASKIFGSGPTFMDNFDNDQFFKERQAHPHYPFASKAEWQLASFLLRSGLSMAAMDKFFKLELVKRLGLSFGSAKDLRSRAEMLPSGPPWMCKPLQTEHPTKNKIYLYYRDPVECLRSLMRSPLLKDHLDFTPRRLFEDMEKLVRIYTEWLSGDAAWSMQEKLPPGATLLGTILSSDKTNISAMTGNRVAHPLLISLANIAMDFRTKSSNDLFLLLALLPIPRFIHPNKKICGVLESRLFHSCLDIILEPLKKATQFGLLMEDPLGLPGKTSSVTMASYKQFGDNYRHEPRTPSTMLAHLQAVESVVDPWELEAYVKEAMKYRLNGVHRPFWRDWPLANPSVFLTSEPLHHWHKQFWDHDVKWCMNAVGKPEFDFRFAVLHPQTGFRHFKEGISSLKQVTGREHRDVQRYIVSVIADAVPRKFLVAVRALLDFRYLAQSRVISDKTCSSIEYALHEFHSHKQAILDAGARRGQKSPIDNWYIPKLEFFQSVVPNIQENGVAIQWSADTTEHANITAIKDPARSGNNQDYEPQICRYLDRLDKLRQFDLATSIKESKVDFRAGPGAQEDSFKGEEAHGLDEGDLLLVTSSSSLLTHIDPVSSLSGSSRKIFDFFDHASELKRSLQYHQDVPLPLRTYACTSHVAIHLSRDPSYKRLPVDEVAQMYHIPDLRPALSDYLQRTANGKEQGPLDVGGRRLSQPNCDLPFTYLEIWKKVHLQSKSYHRPHTVLPAQTINASPPSSSSTLLGQFDNIIMNIDPVKEWPFSGLNGHIIVDLQLIFRIVPSYPHEIYGNQFLTYVRRFDIVPQINAAISGSRTLKGPYPEPSSGLYVLKRSKRSTGVVMGDVLPLDQIRSLANLTPRFGNKASRILTKENSLEYCAEFWLNKYFTKELFLALN
ncbi:hypothetical protein BYT27DRAFT_7111964 [Phlegmacium glaucopus]|nr:hypothetical protein BYT27DRAFT_7111964 [Phlegmacium glaucopus]